jgi:hypothetical protein
MDELDIKIARLKELNPLNSIEIHFDVLIPNVEGVVKFEETMVIDAIR